MAVLGQFVEACASGTIRPGLQLIPYPPEWEAAMLTRLPSFATNCAQAGRPVETIDLGGVLLREIEGRADLPAALAEEEKTLGTQMLLDDLGARATRAITALLQRPPDSPAVCRLLYNAGALATFTSFSALANAMVEPAAAATVLAFPGDGDNHRFSLLNLRPDTDYRTPRL